MSPEIVYFLKVSIAIAMFYAFYRLFFSKDTFFNWRRAGLLCMIATSLLYPLLNIQGWVQGNESLAAAAHRYAAIMLPGVEITAAQETAGSWGSILLAAGYLYLGVVVLLSARFLARLASIVRIRLCSRKAGICGHNVYILNKQGNPFSFFGWIFVHAESHSPEELEEIITHELAHARQWHSIDVIVSELLCIACWFNPFVWLLKKEIRNNLEFLADNRVLEKGYEHRTYQYHLLQLAYHKPIAALYNDFNVLPLKNRIKMMNRKRTKKIGKTKYMLFIPVAAALLILSNIDVIARNTEKPIAQSAMSTDTIKPSRITPDDDEAFLVVEVQPQFPGGEAELLQYLAKNIKYPEKAENDSVQGKVVTGFIVNKDGSISDVNIVRSAGSDLDEEAMRVISAMPKWEPGMQKGVAVRVRFSVPILFRLQ